MATNYDSLITALQNTIKTNGTGAITGAVAQAAFLNVVESLTVGFQFMGVATPSTSPDSNDMKEYYIGFAGTYANFGSSVTVPEGSIILFKKDEGAWSSQVVKIADSVTVVDNTLSVGGVEKGELAGTIRNLPEWLYVVVDDENRVLFGVKTNGDFAFGSGCPPQIKEYINEKISELNISSYQDIVSFLGSLIEGDVTLSELLDKKIDGEYSTISEYLFAMVDSNNRVLFAIKTDGSIYFGKSLDRNSEGLKEYDRQIVNYILSVRDSIYFDISKTSDIISLNDPINMKRKLSQMYNSGLMIAHLSDLHGDAENFQRFVNFRNQYRTLIDDSIATGDIIWNKFGDDFDFWSLTETAKNIMISIGNHETCLTDENQVWSSASEQDVY